MNQSISEAEQSNEFQLKELINNLIYWFKYLKTKWHILLIAIFLGAIIGYIIISKNSTKYKAVITYIMEEGQSSSINNPMATNFGSPGMLAMGSSSPGGIFSGSNLSELMRTRLIADKVLMRPVLFENRRITLADYYLIINRIKEGSVRSISDNKIIFQPFQKPESFTENQEQILRSIYSDLITPEKLTFAGDTKSAFLQIAVVNENEIFAKLLCENILSATSDFYIESKTLKSKRIIEIIEKQLDSIKIEYNKSLINQASASDNVFNLNPSYKVKGILPIRKQIEVQTNSTLLNSLITNLESAKSNLRYQTPLFQVIERPRLPLKKISVNSNVIIISGIIISLILTILILVLIKIIKRLI